MTVYIQRTPCGNDWAEGAWYEIIKGYDTQEWHGEDVDCHILISPISAQKVPGDISLKDFVHPAADVDVVYHFGPDNGVLQQAPTGCNQKVYIPQVRNHVTMWSHQAAAAVMYDRIAKHGNS